MTTRTWRQTLSAAAALGLFLAGCRPGTNESGPKGGGGSTGSTEVLLLGLDGASWDLLQPMMDRGLLPNLRRLVDEGVRARMASELPCDSIVLWTTVASGKPPSEHGITDWGFEDEANHEGGPMNSSHRQVEALWNIVSASGGRVGFVNWWATWPAEPVRGYVVSDYFARAEPEDEVEETTFPPELARGLEPVVDRGNWPWLDRVLAEEKLKLFSDRKREQGKDSGFESREKLAWFFYGPDIIGERAALHLLDTQPKPDVFGIISRKGDLASHYMWEFAASRELEDISRVLEPVYQYEDEMLGRLLERVGPHTNVIVLSDHGFAWEGELFNHTATAPDGIFIASGPAFKKGISLPRVTLYDIAPTVLQVLGIPVGRDMAHEPLMAAIALDRPIQWVDTHETGRRREQTRSPLEERLLEELRTLGYVK